jgi:hypothetical protein
MSLMLTKEEILKAAEQRKLIEKQYPEFYKLHIMMLELNKHKINGATLR